MKKEIKVDIIEEATSGVGVTIKNPNFSSSTDRNGLMKLINQSFTGVVNCSYDMLHYQPYTVDTNVVCTLGSSPIIGGGAFVRMIADGTHTPVLTAFKKCSGSQDWDTTLNAVHLVMFGYDGVDVWYFIDKDATE